MAKDFFGWSKWSPHLGNAITIIFGIQTMIGVLAGLWAWAAPTQGLFAILVALAAFLMALWITIGITWLRDRADRQNPNKSVKLLDCSWALRVDGATFTRDVNSSEELEWQLRVLIRNTSKWPLRVDIINQNCVIENMIPDVTLENKMPFIALPEVQLLIAFPPYKKGSLPDKERYKGNITFSIRYGHPDGEYSRIMKRNYVFEQVIRPTLPGPIQKTLIPKSGSMPIILSPLEEDRDEPYVPRR